MLKKLRSAVERCFLSLKLAVKCNRYLLLAVCVAGVLGLIFAVSACGKAQKVETVNIFILIQTDSFSFLAFFLKLFLYYFLFAFLLFMSACHFYFLCASFVGVVGISFFFCKNAVISMVCDGFAGFAMFIFYILPIGLLFLFTYFWAMKAIYPMVGYDCNRKRFSNINYHKKFVFKIIFKMLLINLFFDLSITVIIAIFASLG